MSARDQRRPLLFARYPALEAGLPWVALADCASTPVEPLPGLADAWGVGSLSVKRDDRTSSIYGGNKVRKLEWILAAAKKAGRRAVITTGAWGSHHALATALFAREVGMRATLVLFPQPPTAHVRDNYLMDVAVGARVMPALSVATVPIAWLRGRLAAHRAGEGWPQAIAAGGSDGAGTLGYVEAGLELAAQVANGEVVAPDFVYVAAGTCGTAAGLALGLHLASAAVPQLHATRVVAVRVVPSVMANRRRARRLVGDALRRLRGAGAVLDVDVDRCCVEFLGDYVGRGYGHRTAAAEAVREQAAELDGLTVDSTYTAKALAGVRGFATAAEEIRRANHLYVHTLGARPELELPSEALLPRRLRR